MFKVQISEQVDDAREVLRRKSNRHEPVRRDGSIAWWGDPGRVAEADAYGPDGTGDFEIPAGCLDGDPEDTAEFEGPKPEPKSHRVFALLLDISASGARVVVDRMPDCEKPLWFRLDGGRSADWSEAKVVGLTTTPRGPHILRLAFRVPFPFETLREAVCG